MHSSSYRISLTTKIFHGLFCCSAPQPLCRIRRVDLFSVFISSLAAPHLLSLGSEKKKTSESSVVPCEECLWEDWVGLGKRGHFIQRKFLPCKAYHSKVHAQGTKEERGEGETLQLDFTPLTLHTHPPFSALLLQLLLPVCVCKWLLSLSLSSFALRHLPDF